MSYAPLTRAKPRLAIPEKLDRFIDPEFHPKVCFLSEARMNSRVEFIAKWGTTGKTRT